MRRRALLGTAAAALSGCAQAAPAPWGSATGNAGHGVPALDAQQGELLLIQRSAGRPAQLLRMPWNESEGDRPEPPPDTTVPLLALADQASDPMVPVRDGPFWRDPARWLLWREGATIHALDTTAQRQAIRLPAAPAALLLPPLQRGGGPVDLFVLAAGGRTVSQLRFARSAAGPAQVVAETALPAAARLGSAAFAAAGALAWALWAPQARGTLLLLHDGTGLRQLALPGLQAQSPPALLADADGLWVAGVMRGDGSLLVVEARFPAGGVASVTRRALDLHASLRAAALVYRRWEGAARALHGLLMLADGSLRKLDEQGAATAFEAPAAPVLPLSLVPTAGGAMLLCMHPQRGPLMAPL